MTNRQLNAVADAIRDSIRDNSGGHELRDMIGQKLWHANQPVRLNEAAQAAIDASDAKYVPILVQCLRDLLCHPDGGTYRMSCDNGIVQQVRLLLNKLPEDLRKAPESEGV